MATNEILTADELMMVFGQSPTCPRCACPIEDGECPKCCNVDPVRRAIACLFTPGNPVELRALRADGSTWGGLYTDHERLAADALTLGSDRLFKAVYTTLNSISQAWLKSGDMPVNRCDRLVRSTKDSDITRRQWLLVDLDPVRPANTSSTDAELNRSEELSYEVAHYLSCEHDWPRPYFARSGNGTHLLYRLDLENTHAITTTIEFVLKALSQKFSTEQVHIDTAVGNAARITKCYGTIARKGTNDGSRPWRESALLDPTAYAAVVTLEQLEKVAATYVGERKATKKTEFEGLHDDFDMDALTEHFDLAVIGTEIKDGAEYHFLDSCPNAGHKHSGTAKKSALVLTADGGLGFSCFSDDCAEATIGDVLRKLSEEYGRYPGVIWKRPADQWDDAVFADGEEMDWAGDTAESAPTPALIMEVETAPTVAPAPVDAITDELFGLVPEEPEETSYLAPENVDDSPVPFPEEALYGWLGKKTLELDGPLGLAYPAMLTVYSSLGINTNQTLPNPRPLLYTALLAGPGLGKSVVMNRACATLPPQTDCEYLRKQLTPGSDRGVFRAFQPGKNDPDIDPDNPPTGIFIMDEMKALLDKAKIQNSALASVLNSLYYQNEGSSSDKTGVHTVAVKLSLLGALPIADESEFSDMFGSETTKGLYSRFVFGIAPSKWKWNHRWKAKPELRSPSKVRPGDLAYDMTEKWREQMEDTHNDHNLGIGRLAEIALRVAVISAAANGDAKITEECMKAALDFAGWQLKVRQRYSAGVSETIDGRITAAVITTFEGLRDSNGVSQWVRWWDVVRKKSWNKRFGAQTLDRTKKALIEDGTLVEELIDPDNDEGKKKSNRTGYVRLRNKSGVDVGSSAYLTKLTAKSASSTKKGPSNKKRQAA